MDTISMVKIVLVMMLFYSFSITIITYALPDDAKGTIELFKSTTTEQNLNSITGDVQNSLNRQRNLPLVEIGSIIFYSGNILIDLLMNFVFAIPQMIGFLIHAIEFLISPDTYIFAVAEALSASIIITLYIIGIIQVILNLRGQGRIT